ncbi:hypothetical protein BDZ90DRAFT_261187 [Jaminaea rosea]|uniref:CHCH domain-containing protein n=1 Tax=Jaminaea rosea TaxID=1569628 RepID=A0A316UQ69_9BASI|nr:hypothetical protein BDZ90DRAFT_261187 [Jaminaea rosea]PWN26938.1 hypothetical protein BDZ90DRAFT_261187 [Jaminaea rosea]
MKIRQLKVRPKHEAATSPCAAELAAMLACWASTHDTANAGACRDAAKGLQNCMRLQANGAGRVRGASTINYHLAKWSKGS